MWTFFVALVRLCGLVCTYVDNFGVVQATMSGEEACTSDNDADWRCLIWRHIDDIVEAGT